MFAGNVWQLNFNPVLVVLIAIVVGLVLVAFFILLFVRWRSLKPPMHRYRGKTNTVTSCNIVLQLSDKDLIPFYDNVLDSLCVAHRDAF